MCSDNTTDELHKTSLISATILWACPSTMLTVHLKNVTLSKALSVDVDIVSTR